MRYKWLYKNNNNKLIVFFNGWGMDESVVKHLDPENNDVLMFYDYNSLDCDFDFDLLDKFSEINLIAWSMGVMTATLFDIKYNKKIAVNGTLKPIDNEFGIPIKIYELTLNNFNINSAEKFISNMFDSKTKIEKIHRDFTELKTELASLKTYKANTNFHYDRVIISSKDKIIPTKHQIAFWGISPNIDAGHAPFLMFKKWSELL